MIDISKLLTRIKEECYGIDEDFAKKYAIELVETLDPRLMKNLSEWVDKEVISDVWVGKYCVNAIMSIRGDKDFLSALEAMNAYLHDESKGVSLIWRGKR